MRTVTEIFEVYTFAELNEKAKDKVRDFYGETRESWLFTLDCEEYLKSILTNSDLSVHYNLSYCQGDFLSIYGEVNLSDVLNKLSDYYSSKEIKYLRWLVNKWCTNITINERNYYGSDYFSRSKVDFASDVVYDMEYNNIRGIRHDLIESFENNVYFYINNLCDNLKNDGYAYFYEYTDDDIEDCCDCNEYEFLENGLLYA